MIYESYIGAAALNQVVVATSVQTIGNSAFSGSGLRNLLLPTSVTYIGQVFTVDRLCSCDASLI